MRRSDAVVIHRPCAWDRKMQYDWHCGVILKPFIRILGKSEINQASVVGEAFLMLSRFA